MSDGEMIGRSARRVGEDLVELASLMREALRTARPAGYEVIENAAPFLAGIGRRLSKSRDIQEFLDGMYFGSMVDFYEEIMRDMEGIKRLDAVIPVREAFIEPLRVARMILDAVSTYDVGRVEMEASRGLGSVKRAVSEWEKLLDGMKSSGARELMREGALVGDQVAVMLCDGGECDVMDALDVERAVGSIGASLLGDAKRASDVLRNLERRWDEVMSRWGDELTGAVNDLANLYDGLLKLARRAVKGRRAFYTGEAKKLSQGARRLLSAMKKAARGA